MENKSRIILPDQIFGRKVDGAMEKVLQGDKTPEVQEQPTPQINAANLKGYVWVPSINLYVAKERSLLGLSWNKVIEGIYNMGVSISGTKAEIPTPFEFMNFVKYLSAGKISNLAETERQAILDDILKIGAYRGNWLNARFVKRAGGFNDLGIETHNFDSSGKPVIITAPLEQCLMSDGWADINSGNSQGLLTKSYGSNNYEQGKNVYFWYPRETGVARFDAYSGRAGLDCNWDADGSYPSLGVRLVVRPKGARVT